MLGKREGAPAVTVSMVGEVRNALDAQEKKVLSLFDSGQQATIVSRQKTLSALGYFIGKDFDIPIVLGLPDEQCQSGWKWGQFKDRSSYMQVNAQDLAEKSMDFLRFVTSHEAGHRRITRGWLLPEELMKEPGFNIVWNYLEDPRDNNFVAEAYPKFREQMTPFYNEMMEKGAKEMELSKEKLGTVPRFQLASGEYLTQWWAEMQGKPISVNESLPDDVKEVLRKTLPAAQEYWWRYPSKDEAEGGEKIVERYAGAAHKIFLDQIWPHVKTLIDEDMKDQEVRKMLEKMAEKMPGEKKDGQEGEEGEPGEGMPKELEDMLSGEEKQELENAMREFKEGEGKPADIDKLSPGLKEKLQKYVESLVEEMRKELEEMAKKAMEEFEKELAKEMAGRIEQATKEPSKDSKSKEKGEKTEKKDSEGEDDDKDSDPPPPVDPKDAKEVRDKFAQLAGDKNVYERNMREVLPVIDHLENDLRELFVHRQAHTWETGFKFGKKLDIKKRMQEKAKGVSAFDSRAWQKREAPGPKDYAITLLVDLSGSMRRGKIEETFKAVVALAEVLNTLSIRNEITGFQDVPIPFKTFDEPFGDTIREKMSGMLLEVSNRNPGGHNNMGDNDDGVAVQSASASLARRDEKEKILIVLSDGIPVMDSDRKSMPQLAKELRGAIQSAGEKGQKLIGLGIGPDTEHVTGFYPNSLANVPVEEMAEKLADLIRTVIEDPNSF